MNANDKAINCALGNTTAWNLAIIVSDVSKYIGMTYTVK
jgi:hypothetical protein